MAKELIYNVTDVHLTLNKKNPPDLVIDAGGETRTNNWTDPELQPWIYIQPPPDGVYDFDFVAEPPRGPSNDVITPIQAQYVWKDLPDEVRGIRVHSETNSVTEWLRPCQSCRLIDFEEAEVVFFPGLPPQHLLVVRGQKPYLNMRVELVPLPHVGMPEYTRVEVVGCNGTLPAFGPYEVMLDLAGHLGSKGIEVVGANRSQKIDVPNQARKVESKAGVRVEKK
ncbi:MAG TPA: hypothetical protein VF173_30875 [Thermoanaerobaculia bacterium]|nr:hypothetical protein [Thermoanaerobaculia bacterium]